VITTKCEKFQGGNGQDTGSSAVLKTYRFQPVEEIMEVPLQTAMYGGLTAAAESFRIPRLFFQAPKYETPNGQKGLTGRKGLLK